MSIMKQTYVDDVIDEFHGGIDSEALPQAVTS